MPLEALRPVVGPLLVQMVLPALVRDRRREEDGWAQPDEGLDENVAGLGREVLADLQAHDEVELPIQPQRHGEVVKEEPLLRDPKRLRGRVPVDPEVVVNAQPGGLRQPDAGSATDVGDRVRLKRLHKQGQDTLGRELG